MNKKIDFKDVLLGLVIILVIAAIIYIMMITVANSGRWGI